MRGRKEAKRAREEAQRAAEEARVLRAETMQKEKEEREKAQRKLIRGIKGRFNPFTFTRDEKATLGGGDK